MLDVLIIIIVLAVMFDIANGWHDCANAITTAVAKTIGTGIVDPTAVTNTVIIAALLSAILWNLITILMGLPVSSSHALVGGLIGAGAAHGGLSILNIEGITKIFLSLLISPILGFVIGFLFMKLILKLFGQLAPGTISKQ